MIKHLKPRSKREVFYNHIIDFIKNPFGKKHKKGNLLRGLISIVPLSSPRGLIFYLDYKYKRQVPAHSDKV